MDQNVQCEAPPGFIARIVTEQIGRTRGVAFAIENRPGAGTLIGAEAVARAAPDGNTLLINTSAILINAHMLALASSEVDTASFIQRLQADIIL